MNKDEMHICVFVKSNTSQNSFISDSKYGSPVASLKLKSDYFQIGRVGICLNCVKPRFRFRFTDIFFRRHQRALLPPPPSSSKISLFSVPSNPAPKFPPQKSVAPGGPIQTGVIQFLKLWKRKPSKMPTALAIETEKCGKCEKPVFEAEGFPAGK